MNPPTLPLEGGRKVPDLAGRAAQLDPPPLPSGVVVTANPTPQPTTMTVLVTATTEPTSDPSSLTTGGAIGLALGLLVLIALVAFAVFLFVRRRRTARRPRVDPYAAAEATPMTNLRPRTSILKRPGGGMGVLSSVNDRTGGHGWVRLDTEDRASLDYAYDDSTNPPSYSEASNCVGPSAQPGASGTSGGANAPTPGTDATAFRVQGSNRNSAGFRMVRGARVDEISQSGQAGHAQERQAQEPRVFRLDPIDTSCTVPPGPASETTPTTPTPLTPPTPRASRMTSFRGGHLHRYDTFGRRREETPSALFDVDGAIVETAIVGQRAGPAWAPPRL